MSKTRTTPSVSGTEAPWEIRKASKPSQNSDGLLEIYANAIDDMRSLVACKICTKPMYEPYTTSCGHSYCYSCLVQWFSSHSRTKTCPGCRTKITQQPVPDYTIRNIVQVLISHPAFLEEGDTLEKLRADQKDEAKLVEKDKSNNPQKAGALFQGYFKDTPTISIYDASDGVHRCPTCNWELEHGYCYHCGRIFDLNSDSNAFLGFSEDDEDDDDEDEDDDEDDDDDGGSQDTENLRSLYQADDRGSTDGFDARRTSPFYAPGHTPPVYDSEGEEQQSTSTEDLESLQIRRVALGSGDRGSGVTGRDSIAGWSETESDSEVYARAPRSLPRSPITWANHPNFARRASDPAFIDENDSDMDDFIDDGSLNLSPTETEPGEEDIANDEASADSDDDVPIATRRRRIVPNEGPNEEVEAEAAAPISSRRDTNSGMFTTNEDKESISSSESAKLASTQQRKRRRMVVLDDSEEEDVSSRLNERSRLRRRLIGQTSTSMGRRILPQAVRRGFGSRPVVHGSFESPANVVRSLDQETFSSQAEQSLRCVTTQTRSRRRPSVTSQPSHVIASHIQPGLVLQSRISNMPSDGTLIGSCSLLP